MCERLLNWYIALRTQRLTLPTPIPRGIGDFPIFVPVLPYKGQRDGELVQGAEARRAPRSHRQLPS